MEILERSNGNIGIVDKDVEINEVRDILDFMMTANYRDNCASLIIYKESLNDDFFDLKTGFAGEVLQKFSNYKMKLAIIGDFSLYRSRSLNDFINESNRGNTIFFVSSLEEGKNILEEV